ncbi:MAG: aminotransferase class V-fold PLP-dependent enzyme [Rhizobiaceae bacterium]
MLPSKRDLFDIPLDVSFFNAAAWSPLPLSTVEQGKRGVEIKSRPWDFPTGLDEAEFVKARTAAASVIGASSEDVAIIPSVGYGVSTAAKILDLPKGSRILTLQDDHSAPVLEWLTREADNPLEVVSIARGSDGDWTSAVLEALMAPAAAPPALLSISSIHWSDGGNIDLEAVQKEAQKIGTMLLVDATHAVGVMPIDVAKLDPDFLIFPTYKWLLGPYGRAFLYIAKRHQGGVPLEQTSYARKRVVAEDDRHFTDLDYINSAARFDMGERDFFVSLGMATHSIDLIQSWGIDNIRPTIQAYTDRIEAGLLEQNVPVTMLPRHLRAPHVLSLGFPDGMPQDFEAVLQQNRVFAAPRLGRLRITPHVYNNERDCDRLVEVLAKILR